MSQPTYPPPEIDTRKPDPETNWLAWIGGILAIGVLVTLLVIFWPFSSDPHSDALARGKNAVFQENYEEAERILRPAAQDGHMEAQYYLGKIYEDQEMYEDALDWYQRSADQDYTAARGALQRLQDRIP